MTWQPLGKLDIRSVAAGAREIEARKKDPKPLSLDEQVGHERAFVIARQAAIVSLFPARIETDRLQLALRHAVEAGVEL